MWSGRVGPGGLVVSEFLTKNPIFFGGRGGRGVFFYKLLRNPNLTFFFGWGGGGGEGKCTCMNKCYK